ncbi:hypothetical protein ABBQ32_008120 [Trebouxia sp. C0010 RCD-2024]
METKLNLASKQEQPSLAALQHADERNTPQRGGHGPARRPGRRGGCGPYPNNRGGGRQSNRGYSGRGLGGRGRGNSSHNSVPYSQLAPANGANSQPLGNRTANAVNKAAGPGYDEPAYCEYCRLPGHAILDCRNLRRDQLQRPSNQGIATLHLQASSMLFAMLLCWLCQIWEGLLRSYAMHVE